MGLNNNLYPAFKEKVLMSRPPRPIGGVHSIAGRGRSRSPSGDTSMKSFTQVGIPAEADKEEGNNHVLQASQLEVDIAGIPIHCLLCKTLVSNKHQAGEFTMCRHVKWWLTKNGDAEFLQNVEFTKVPLLQSVWIHVQFSAFDEEGYRTVIPSWTANLDGADAFFVHESAGRWGMRPTLLAWVQSTGPCTSDMHPPTEEVKLSRLADTSSTYLQHMLHRRQNNGICPACEGLIPAS